MESKPQNQEFRINPENCHHCIIYCIYHKYFETLSPHSFYPKIGMSPMKCVKRLDGMPKRTMI